MSGRIRRNTQVRKNLKASSIARKLLIYHTTYREKLHTKHFGFKHFRVLTVTQNKTGKRIDSMVEAAQRLPGLQGLFLFADIEAVLSGDVLVMEWVNGKGGSCTIALVAKWDECNLSLS